ncbi:MAG: response regulator [Deltaproteobacteria bacterium]|nr:response regulator [Deltaproteobacteria bacterium]
MPDRKIITPFHLKDLTPFLQELAEMNARGTRLVCVLCAVLVPLFSVLDYFVLGPVFGVLLAVRLSVAITCMVIFFITYRPWAKQRMNLLAGTAVVMVSLMVVAMVHLHDMLDPPNAPSNYYAGIMLVVTGATLLLTWTLRTSVTVFSLVYLAYLIPTVLFQFPPNGILYLANNFFLGSTIIISIVGHHFSYGLKMREFFATRELAQANDALGSANERLKEMDRFKSQFFSNMTHELKTPLTLILAPTEAAMNGELGEFSSEQQEYFRRIFNNGLRLMKLINDLLDLARLEDSKLKLRVEEMELNEFALAVAGNIKPLAERKGIELTVEVPQGAVTVWADRDRLEQVLVNLLANAVKFTPESGRIAVRVEESGEQVLMAVTDSGIGIPTDKLESVFDRFSQVDGTTTRKYGGTGIGLALARELTALHGGRIWAESDGFSGTSMKVMLRKGSGHFNQAVLDRRTRAVEVSKGRREADGGLPQWSARIEERKEYRYLAVDEASERRIVPRRDVAAGSGSARVLVVEDSKEMLQFLELQLRSYYKVFLAEDGARGWELVRKHNPDLVITDYMMPEMDGKELTQLIKGTKETSHIPVVMLTAKAATDDRVAGKEAGADEYLAKPFSTSELLAVVKALLKACEQQADRMTEQRMDSMEVMAARLAHEIHNPLNYVKNGAGLIRTLLERLLKSKEGSEDLKVQKDVATIRTLMEQVQVGTERISRTVEKMKEYAREGYEKGTRGYDVDRGIEAVLQVVRPVDGAVRRTVEFAPQGAGEIECVPQEFHEIVSNLVQNALDATPEDGLVRVEAVGEGNDVVIRVSDNGAGMDAQTIDKIFTPFFTTKEPGRGMGMGLTIVYRLVRKAGGRVDVRSELGAGSTFTVRLPRRAPDGEAKS